MPTYYGFNERGDNTKYFLDQGLKSLLFSCLTEDIADGQMMIDIHILNEKILCFKNNYLDDISIEEAKNVCTDTAYVPRKLDYMLKQFDMLISEDDIKLTNDSWIGLSKPIKFEIKTFDRNKMDRILAVLGDFSEETLKNTEYPKLVIELDKKMLESILKKTFKEDFLFLVKNKINFQAFSQGTICLYTEVPNIYYKTVYLLNFLANEDSSLFDDMEIWDTLIEYGLSYKLQNSKNARTVGLDDMISQTDNATLMQLVFMKKLNISIELFLKFLKMDIENKVSVEDSVVSTLDLDSMEGVYDDKFIEFCRRENLEEILAAINELKS